MYVHKAVLPITGQVKLFVVFFLKEKKQQQKLPFSLISLYNHTVTTYTA
jgi:hypothetical protein